MKFGFPFLCCSKNSLYTTQLSYAMVVGSVYSISLLHDDSYPDISVLQDFCKHTAEDSPYTINSALLIKISFDNRVYDKKFDCVIDQPNAIYTFELPNKQTIDLDQTFFPGTNILRYSFGPYKRTISSNATNTTKTYNQTIILDTPMQHFLQEHAKINVNEHMWTRPLLMRTISSYLKDKRIDNKSTYMYDKPIYDLFELTEQDRLSFHDLIRFIGKHVSSIEHTES